MSPASLPFRQAVGRHLEWTLIALLGGLWTLWLLRVPGMLEGLDYTRYYFFNVDWLRRSLLAGEFPWWNPHIGLGRPFFADLQTGTLYPPHLLQLPLGIAAGTAALVWWHQAWAMLGMRRLALILGCGSRPAWCAAVAFLVAPSLSARLIGGQIHYAHALCYLPGLFWILVRALQLPTRGRHAALAGVSGFQLLSGHPQVYWVTALGLGVFTFTWTVGDGWRAVLTTVGRVFGALLLGLMLTAPVLLPFLELIKESNRASVVGALSGLGALSLADWVALVRPPLGSFVPDIEGLVLVGAPVVVAAFAAIRSGWRHDRGVRALTGVIVVAALLASSLPPWLHTALDFTLPGFASFRLPSRAGVLVVFALFLLAAKWLSTPHAQRGLALVGLALTGVTLIAALPALRLWYGLPAFYPAEPAVAGLVRELQTADPAHVPPRLNFSARHVRENSGMVTGHSTFNAYVSLYLARPWAYIHALVGLPPPETINSFPDVRIFEHDPFASNAMAFVGGFDTRTQQMRMNSTPDPRAYLCFAASVVPWRTAIRLMTNDHDFHRTALVESPLPSTLPGAGRGTATITAFSASRVALRTESSVPAVLVLAEAWYPGWEASVNGGPALAFPVNGWMRGVVVPAGRAEVEWRFRQRWFWPGCAVALVGFTLLAWRGMVPATRG